MGDRIQDLAQFGTHINNYYKHVPNLEKDLLELAREVGFPSVSMAERLTGRNLTAIKNISNLFVILTYNIEPGDGPVVYIRTTRSNIKYPTIHGLVDVCVLEGTYLILTGYFRFDPSITIEMIYPSCKKIPPNLEWSHTYSQYMHPHMILTLTQQQYLNIIKEHHAIYLRLIGASFVTLVSQFIELEKLNDIVSVYWMLHLLLLGGEEPRRIAQLFFNVCTFADLIYDNLPFGLKQLLTPRPISITLPSVIPDYVQKEIALKQDENTDKSRLYVSTLLAYPWTNTTGIHYDLNYIQSELDLRLYGQQPLKQYMLGVVGKWVVNANAPGNVLGLSGAPGVGKTYAIQVISQILKLPFIHINLGGVTDNSVLTGHGYTYVDSHPGVIISKLAEVKESRCIIFMDELDKAGHDLFNTITYLTDPETGTFQDRFFSGINFPIEQIFWIFAFNDATLIDAPLLNRLTVITMEGYSVDEKIEITSKYLLPEINSVYNSSYEITLPDIQLLLCYTAPTPGLREIKKMLDMLISQVNLVFLKTNIQQTITTQTIQSLFGQHTKQIALESQVGVIRGLSVSSLGSSILYITAARGHLDKPLLITGLVKREMRESIFTAYTAALNYLHEPGKKFDPIHIHVSNSTYKDGASAGAAFAIVIISLLLNVPVHHNIIVSATIDVHGALGSVASLQTKLLAVDREKHVIVVASKLSAPGYNLIYAKTLEELVEICLKK